MNQIQNEAVRLTVERNVLIATIDNPPVNALSHSVRAGLVAAVDRLEQDDKLVAMVITANGKQFCSGADVKEFGKPMVAPLLGEVIKRLDAAKKPIVAAMQGAALGGGLEVPLACNIRVAAPSVKMGLPEVKLGILPGSGGILRLPRLIGIDAALSLITEGKQISAAEALKLGVIDAVIEGDLVAGAVEKAEAAAAAGELRRTSDLPFPAFSEEAQAEARAAMAKKHRGREAPLKAVELFAMAATTPFAEAVELEYAACKELLGTSQSRALRHIFAAEREAAKVPDVAADTKPRKIETVGVVGPGTMGRGIAAALLDKGFPVVLVGLSDESMAKATAAIQKIFDGSVKRGLINEAQAAERMARLTTSTEHAALKDVDMVIESVDEDLDTKRALIAALDNVLREDAIVATNTSFLDIEKLAAATKRPENFAGMHFFNPANIMKLVENVRTSRTAPDVTVTIMDLAKKLGKSPVLAGACDGFVANRMLSKRTREALFLVQDGATPSQVDRVLAKFFPLGPFALADLAGLDVMSATRRSRMASMSDRERNADIAETLVAAGRLGRKTNAGYYAYGEDGKPTPDPIAEEIIAEHRKARGIPSREITDEEVMERCILALVNEGAKLMDEGVVSRAGDIDVAWVRGLGFPEHLGGPMFWASEMGLPRVRDALRKYSELVGPEYFTPAKIIEDLAEKNERFS